MSLVTIHMRGGPALVLPLFSKADWYWGEISALAWLAGKTTKIELGTTVIIIPYRSPLLTARMGANIDQMSNGRFILGAGIGWAQQEFDALGVPFHQRGAMTNDYLEAIKKLWTHELASHEGPFVSFTDVHASERIRADCRAKIEQVSDIADN